MTTLSFGYQLPSTGDKGSALWTALQNNIIQLNNHDHDGLTSSTIPGSNIGSSQVAVPHASWATYSGAPIGHYRQLVTCAAGYTFSLKNIAIQDSSGRYIYAGIEMVSPTTFYVYSTDPTVDMVANFGG